MTRLSSCLVGPARGALFTPLALRAGLMLGVVLFTTAMSRADDDSNAEATPAQATAALRKAVGFYRTQVGYQGAYLYKYSADLSKQEGEHDANRTTGWTQPPGTPSVGAAYLDAYLQVGDDYLLAAAREAGEALLRGQLDSGGWSYKFELGERDRLQHAYRLKPNNAKGRNYTTLDDNKSQSALMFLMHLDEVLQFKDQRIHEAVEYALNKFVKAQFPNGAWPQQFSGPPDPSKHPVLKASLPTEWSREYRKADYRQHYTFNDNAMSDMIDVMLEAHRIYGVDAYRRAAEKTGDFMLLAQLPDPQPGWAQQYNYEMHPSWARKFEPPAITGGESQGVMRSLLTLFRHTGKPRFLAPIPRALAYYRKSLLPDGRLARFYEMRSNKPLYFTKKYELTYSDADMPTHYGFQVGSRLDSIKRDYDQLKADGERKSKRTWRPAASSNNSRLRREAAQVIAAMDDRGAWLESGRLRTYGDGDDVTKVITMKTFLSRLRTLSRLAGANDR